MTNAPVFSALIHLASYVVSAAWQVPVLFAAGWLSAHVLRRVSPAAEHNIWELTLLLCLLLPALPASHVTGHGITVEIAEARFSSRIAEQTGTNLPWRGPVWIPAVAIEAVCGLWALTALFAAIRLGLAIHRTRRLVAAASPRTLPPDLEALWHDSLRRFGVREARILTSHSVAGPMTVTLSGRTLLLPEDFIDEVSHLDFRAAAAHECAHMQRNDFRNNLAYELVMLPLAFHPALRLFRRQLVASREVACDRAAAEAMGDAGAYRGALLRLAAWMVGNHPQRTLAMGAAVGIFDSNSLEERMERLKLPAGNTGTSVRVALVAIAVTCVGITAFAAAAGAVRLAPLTYTISASSLPAAPPTTGTPVTEPIATMSQVTPSSAKPTTKKPTTYKVGGEVTAPVLVLQVDPDYPEELRHQGDWTGECRIGLVVDTSGAPQDVHIVQSLGKGLDENALAAIRQYRFKPGTRHGQPVPVSLTISVNYQHF